MGIPERMRDYGGYIAGDSFQAGVDAWTDMCQIVLEAIRSQGSIEKSRKSLEDSPSVLAEGLQARAQAELVMPLMLSARRCLPIPSRDLSAKDGKTARIPIGYAGGLASLLATADLPVVWVAVRSVFGPESWANPGLLPLSEVWNLTRGHTSENGRLTAALWVLMEDPAWKKVMERASEFRMGAFRKDVAYPWSRGYKFPASLSEDVAKEQFQHVEALLDRPLKQMRSGLCMPGYGLAMDVAGRVRAYPFLHNRDQECGERATRYFSLGGHAWAYCDSHTLPSANADPDEKIDPSPYEIAKGEYEASIPKWSPWKNEYSAACYQYVSPEQKAEMDAITVRHREEEGNKPSSKH